MSISRVKDIPEVISILSSRMELLDIHASLKETFIEKFGQLLDPNLSPVAENEELLAAIREQSVDLPIIISDSRFFVGRLI